MSSTNPYKIIFGPLEPNCIADLISYADTYVCYVDEMQYLNNKLYGPRRSSTRKTKRRRLSRWNQSNEADIQKWKTRKSELDTLQIRFEEKAGLETWSTRRRMLRKLMAMRGSLKAIQKLIGMIEVKENLFDLILCVLQGLTKDSLYNVCITGAPGRGKTELARCIARLYADIGIVRSSKLLECRRDNLVGEYLGQTSIKAQTLLETAHEEGRVVFLDEVTSMGCSGSGSKDSYAKEALDTINHYLYNNKDLVMIVAGYGREASQNVYTCFFDRNPGLIRRFPFVFDIPLYKPSELASIFQLQVKKAGWKLEANVASKEWFVNHSLSFEFGGGDTEILLDRVMICHARRVFSMKKSVRRIITQKDMNKGFQRYEAYKTNHKSGDRRFAKPPGTMYM